MIKCQSCIFYTFVITGLNGRLIYRSIQAANMRPLTSDKLKCPKDSAVDDAFLIYDKPQSIDVLWVIGVVQVNLCSIERYIIIWCVILEPNDLRANN